MDLKKPGSLCAWPDVTDAQLLELQQKHGRVTRLSKLDATLEGEHFCYVRGVRRAEFRAWNAGVSSEAKKVTAYENLVKQVVVHPDAAAIDEHFEKFPALAINFGTLVLELAGGGDGEKKAT